MPHYLIQGGYSSEAWASQITTPQDRGEAVRPMFERLGGKLNAFYLTFGQDDFMILAEFPDNVTVAAVAMAVGATGAIRNLRTTPLLTVQEAMAAMQKAGQVGYRPPTA